MRYRTLIAVAGLAAATLALHPMPAAAHGSNAGQSRDAGPLVGTWKVVITPYDCSSGESFPEFAFRSMFSFAAGGVMTETTSNQGFQPGQRSPGLGYWERTSRSTYESAFEAYVQFTSATTPPAPPRYQRSVQRLQQDITMTDRDHWTSVAGVFWTDFNGAPLTSGCATIAAERLK